MSRRRFFALPAFAFAALFAINASPTFAQSAPPGYADYTDWRDWSRVTKDSKSGLASSYDRLGGNVDYSQYESPPGFVRNAMPATIATLNGPGVVYRFWMPHGTANLNFLVHMFFDGETTPRIDTTSAALFAGSYSYFAAPLVNTAAGGQTCYEPIRFERSLRIETFNQQLPPSGFDVHRHYYQYSYRLFPGRSDIRSYDGAVSTQDQPQRDAMRSLFVNVGANPAGDNPAAIWLDHGATSIPSAASLVLADIAGPGVVRQINVAPGALSDEELQALRLEVMYDQDALPAIDASLTDFFGAGLGRAAYASLPLGTSSPDGFYCYWPMPFHRRVRIALRNAGTAAIPVSTTRVAYETQTIGADAGYLRTRVTSTIRAGSDVHHPILQVSGRGHYVGGLLYLRQDSFNFGMLEGDDYIDVDGAPAIRGTGLEDAYNGGYYYNWVLIQAEPEGPYPQSAIRPLHGILHVHRDDTTPIARADQYRWLIGDRIAFSQSIDVRIENFYGDIGGTWTSVAFWYQQPPVRGDADDDGDVDLLDAAALQRCFPDNAAGCGPTFDLDADADVDAADFGRVCELMNGPW
ncbi:MAG: DUF2961 domain-containing protein [Phycisphaerae bacterium]